MRIITLNANGIRSAERKGFFAWAAEEQPDVICVQETRAQEHQVSPAALSLPGYDAFFVDASRRGYSGVAIYTRHTPLAVHRGLGWPDIDAEGRFVQADFGALTVACVYVPSGVSGAQRQQFKMTFLERFRMQLEAFRQSGREYIVCGDYNIAHRAIDTYDPVRNSRITGFLPEERRWMDLVVDADGWTDAFRAVNTNAKQYTWWSNFPQAWTKNLGWRIDYQLVTPGLAPLVRAASIYKDARFSDHAPVTIDYDIEIAR